MDDSGSDYYLKNSNEHVINKTINTFVDELDINNEFLKKLVDCKILSMESHENIMCRPNRKAKVAQLMKLIKSRGPGALVSLAQILDQEEKTRHLAEIIRYVSIEEIKNDT
ncbi:hypothetical protein A3Q56_04207 [Intoshia linei]|uniref:CARD domain-containing protein n=1 Tax=Intoshia linei TaxID=1819745 RepID=A0A177B1B9_9BILA|nr:hypothetical protein A3Q56_04207 [Intoshia linei]